MKRFYLGTIGIVSLGLLGCGSAAKKTDLSTDAANSPAPVLALSDSTVDIAYVLGHSSHRFLAEAKPGAIQAKTFLDKQLLKESTIDQSRYGDLVQRIRNFVKNAQHQPPENPNTPCRCPFTVQVRIGTESQVANGCRAQDEQGTALSRIARDAEFLLYSKK